jgi:hypothetical protein
VAVAGDAREACVDDGADRGDGEGGLGHVRREHDPPPAVWPEDPVLLSRREPCVEREDLDVVGQGRRQRLAGVSDVALAGQEDEHVAGRVGEDLPDRAAQRLQQVLLLAWGPVADLDGVGPPGHLDDRRGEAPGETRRVDGRRGDDHLEVGALRQQPGEVPEQEVDVEAPLVGLVDDDRVVRAQQPVPAYLGEEDPVGHHLHERALSDGVVEADGVADRPAERDAELLGEPLGDAARGDASRLGVADDPVDASPELQAHLWDLGRLPRSRLPGDHDHLVIAKRTEDLGSVRAHREVLRVADLGDGAGARPAPGPCRLDGRLDLFELAGIGAVPRPPGARKAPEKAAAIRDGQPVEVHPGSLGARREDRTSAAGGRAAP